jgi:uncharacterized protein YbjT (DUF2867 family)
MTTRKIIAVAGATGAQGGGLVRAILADTSGEFAVRAITRDPNAPKARALAAAGAEVVAADIADRSAMDRAFAGAYGAYCVTFFWNHFSPDQERIEAHTMADAAKQAGVQHVVWSTLEDTRRWVKLDDDRMPTLMGHYKVPHFDVKGEADDYFRATGVPTTCLLTSFYWDNLIHFGMGPKAGPDGKLHFALPMGQKPLPGIAAEDIGRCAHGVFKHGQEFAGRTIGIAGEHVTGAQMAAGLTQALGREVTHQDVPFDVYRGLGFPGAEDLGNMFQFKHDFNADFCSARSVDLSRSLNPQLQDFASWAQAHARQIPVT